MSERKYKPYVRLTQEKKDMIIKMFEEKMEQRKIARTMGLALSTVQYHLKKNSKNIKNYTNRS